MSVEKGVGFPITAVDQFSGAFDALKARVVGAASDVSRLTGMLTAFSGAIGLASFASFIKSSIDAHDQINKLSQKVGIAVGELSTFQYAAKLSDVSTESLGKGVKALSQKMIEATDSTSKAGRIMTALGVDVRGGTLPAIQKMADVFAALPDGPTKAALAVEMFGKAGMDMIPLLNQGSEGIAKMRDEAERLGLTMDKETAKAAERFNDNMKAVQASGQRLGITLLNEVAPSIVRISEAMKAAAEDGGVLKAVWVGMGGVMAEAFGLNQDPLDKKIRAISKEVADLQAKIAKGPEDLGGGREDRAFINQYIERVKVLQAELRAAKSLQDAVAGKFDDQASRAARQGSRLPGGANREEEIRNLLGAGRGGEDALREADRLRKLDMKGWVDYAEAVFAQSDKLYTDLAKISDDYWKREDKLKEDDLKGWVAYAEAVFQEADETNLAIAKAAEEKFKKEEGYWSGFLSGIESGFRDVFDRVFQGQINSWRDFVQSMADVFKKVLLDFIYQALARPFVLTLVAVGAGALGLPSLANAATGALGSAALGGSASIAGAGMQILQLLGSPVGMALLGAVAVYAAIRVLRSREGGPKEGGAFYGSYDANGNLIGDVTGSFRRMTPTSGDATMRDVNAAISRGFYDALGRLGGRTSGFTFGTEFDKDPRGSADSRVIGRVLDRSGRSIFDQMITGGRDDKDFEAAMGLMTRRQILAALQASDLPEAVAAILRPLDALTASAEEIDAAIAAAEAMNKIINSLAALNIRGLDVDALKAMAAPGETLEQTLQRVGQAWTWFTDNFYTEAEKLDMAQATITSTFASLGIAVPDSMESFRELVKGLDLSTEAGRTLFQTLMAIAPSFAAVTNAASASLDAFDQLMGRIRPGYTRSLSQSLMGSSVSQFMSANPWTSGMTPAEVIAQLRTITREDYQNYEAGNQTLIRTILDLDSTLNGTTEAVAGLSRSVQDQTAIERRRAFQVSQSSRDDLWAYLQRLVLNRDLTTLTPQDQLSQSRLQFEEAFNRARSGNADAINNLSGFADTYLRTARDYYASSSDYQRIFDQVWAMVASIAKPDQFNYQEGAYNETKRAADVLEDVRDLLIEIRDKPTATSTTSSTYRTR